MTRKRTPRPTLAFEDMTVEQLAAVEGFCTDPCVLAVRLGRALAQGRAVAQSPLFFLNRKLAEATAREVRGSTVQDYTHSLGGWLVVRP